MIAKSKAKRERPTTITIAIIERTMDIEREMKERSKDFCSKNEAKKIKCNNFRWSNKEKCHIDTAILEKLIIELHHSYFTFWGHQ